MPNSLSVFFLSVFTFSFRLLWGKKYEFLLLIGDYEFLCRVMGISGANSRFARKYYHLKQAFNYKAANIYLFLNCCYSHAINSISYMCAINNKDDHCY